MWDRVPMAGQDADEQPKTDLGHGPHSSWPRVTAKPSEIQKGVPRPHRPATAGLKCHASPERTKDANSRGISMNLWRQLYLPEITKLLVLLYESHRTDKSAPRRK